MKRILWVILIVAAITACSKKVPLDKDQFTSLLIDMHTTDGMLSVARGDIRTEKDNYLYYNDLFENYGITREDFDSCVTVLSTTTRLFNIFTFTFSSCFDCFTISYLWSTYVSFYFVFSS